MKAASLLILILTAVLMGLVLSVIFYRPRPVSIVHPSPPRTDDDPEAEKLLQDNLALTERMIRLRWPYSTWLMSFTRLDNSLLMHWKGLSKKADEAILFYVSAERTLQMIMEAVSRMNSDHDQPAYDFWIAVPARYEDSYYTSAEVRRWFLNNGISVHCVYCEGDGLANCFGRDADTAFAAFGTKAMAEFKIEGDEAHVHACKEAMLDMKPAADRFTPTSLAALRELKEYMPLRSRIYMALPAAEEKKTAAAVLLFPFAKDWFNAELSFYEDTFILQAVNEEQKEEAIGTLQKTADKYGVSLKLKAERNTSSAMAPDSPEYASFCTLVRETTEADHVLPVLRNDIYTPHFRGLPAVFFSPMRSLSADSAEKAIRYYYAVLTETGKKSPAASI